jgi:hypothetical protein
MKVGSTASAVSDLLGMWRSWSGYPCLSWGSFNDHHDVFQLVEFAALLSKGICQVCEAAEE